MSKTSLFSNTPVKSKNLVEFKAGKMNIDEKNWVHADKRKGLAYIHLGTDGLTHFCWKDRSSGLVEDDLIVFPEDTEFIRIPQCTTGRVYVLKFKNSKKLFLWLQEPKSDKDEEICKKVNDSLNLIPSQTGANGRVNVGSEVQDLLTGLGEAGYPMSQNEIMTLLGMGTGSGVLGSDSESSSRVSSARASSKTPKPKAEPEVATVTETPSIGGHSKFKISEIHSALSNISKTAGAAADRVSIDLTDVINSSSVLPLLDRPENLIRLEPLLPPKEDVALHLHVRDNVQSPQMHSAVKSFGSALQSGQLGPVLAQFGLGEEVNRAAVGGSVKELARALEAARRVSAEEGDRAEDEGAPMDQD